MVHYRWNTVTDNILCEQDDEGQLLATYTQEPTLYGELISQRRGGSTSYYHYDGQGSTRQLTDENGNVTDEYTYSAFGETVASSETTMNPFRFQGVVGYYLDVSTSEIYIRSRTYNVQRARWHAVDPIGFVDGPNCYVYVSNNPINVDDPSGWAGIKFCYPGTKSCIGIDPTLPQGPPLSTIPEPTLPCPRWLRDDAHQLPMWKCPDCKLTNVQIRGTTGTSYWNAEVWLEGAWSGTYIFQGVADCCCFRVPVSIAIDFNPDLFIPQRHHS